MSTNKKLEQLKTIEFEARTWRTTGGFRLRVRVQEAEIGEFVRGADRVIRVKKAQVFRYYFDSRLDPESERTASYDQNVMPEVGAQFRSRRGAERRTIKSPIQSSPFVTRSRLLHNGGRSCSWIFRSGNLPLSWIISAFCSSGSSARRHRDRGRQRIAAAVSPQPSLNRALPLKAILAQ